MGLASKLALGGILLCLNLSGKTVVKKHGNGKISEQSELNDKGARHGTTRTFYENGKIQSVLTYFHGKLEGPCLYYYDDGGMREIIVYSAGVKLTRRLFDNKGKIIADEEFHPDGTVKKRPSPAPSSGTAVKSGLEI